MTRSTESLLRRVYEQLTSSAAALALTALFLFSVNAAAASHGAPKGSVEILVPTVTIEVLG
jgi:hypothetical protein